MNPEHEWLFGQKYNPLTGGMVRPCSVDEARHRHENGEPYGVLLRRRSDGVNIASADLSSAAPAAYVDFFDDSGRRRLQYTFGAAKKRSGQLFLQKVTTFEYDGSDSEWQVSESYHYKEDGKVFYFRTDKPAGTRREKEGTQEPAALERLYEPDFGFGDYASMFRVERDRDVTDQGEDSPSTAAAATPVA